MTHGDILLRALAQHGRTSLREFRDMYGAQGYATNGFAIAAHRLRRRGVIAPVEDHHGTIVLVGVCPCCGMPL